MKGEWLEVCDSTNDRARVWAEKSAEHGFWVCAQKQTKGRGRMGRTWHSDEGGLFLTLILRPRSQKDWTWVPLAIAAGVLQGLRQLGPHSQFQMKWPNDIYLEGKKCAGILCESSSSKEKGNFLLAGIGINVFSHPSEEGLLQPVTSLAKEYVAIENIKELQEKMVESVLNFWELFQNEGASVVRGVYESMAYFSAGTPITWDQEKKTGVVLGLGEYGELHVKDEEGARVLLYAEDVSVRKSNY